MMDKRELPVEESVDANGEKVIAICHSVPNLYAIYIRIDTPTEFNNGYRDEFLNAIAKAIDAAHRTAQWHIDNDRH